MLKLRNQSKKQPISRPDTPSQDSKCQSVKLSSPIDPWCPSFSTAWRFLFFIRAISAIAFPLLNDCDEVFNYWEPLHYLQYGIGMQTWEYSPTYAIRSWAFITIYAIPAFLLSGFFNLFLRPLSFLLFGLSEKVFVFYGLRMVLGLISAHIETLYYSAVVENISSRIGRYLFLLLTFSPGMFYSASSFLPSTFSMYTTILAFTALIRTYSVRNTSSMSSAIGWPVFWVASGAIIGWPFSGAIGVPLVFHEVFVKTFFQKRNVSAKLYALIAKKMITVVLVSVLCALILLTPVLIIDFIFYRKLVLVPWNIIAYNIFSSEGGSPNLYGTVFVLLSLLRVHITVGTSPWWFYFVNGFLNFNIAFIFALFSIPVVYISYKLFFEHIVTCTNVSFLASSNGSPYQTMVFKLIPVYLWLFIFSLQPHKEERFLYVIYPLICFNAAVSIAFIRGWLEKLCWDKSYNKITRKPMIFTSFLFTAFVILSISRILALHTGYNSMMNLYRYLENNNKDKVNHLCLGQEWYRFPSHYLLPPTTKLHWIDSDFDGQLPKPFPQTPSSLLHPWIDYLHPSFVSWLDSLPGTFEKVEGFNALNKQDPSSISSDSSICDILITTNEEEQEKHGEWKTIKCLLLLDRSTPTLHRAFYVPFHGRSEQTRWKKYCILDRV